MKQKYQYLFGPVPSRRFGRSLGVDPIPNKTCSLDCVFCQLGRTTNKTISRREYVSTKGIQDELHEWLETDGKADYITLSGSGEPTLHSRFGEILEFIRSNSKIPAVLLTNATMLYLPEVREAASIANVVKVSLSAWDQDSYKWVNRPSPQLVFDDLIEGQRAFRAQFKGELWMEVFLITGMNSNAADVGKISVLAEKISPDRIHLNTAVRPPAEGFVSPLSDESLSSMTHLFRPTAEVIAEFKIRNKVKIRANRETILSMLRRRPCTSDQIAETFGMHINEVTKYLGNLIQNDQIRMERKGGTVYYTAETGDYRENVHITH